MNSPTTDAQPAISRTELASFIEDAVCSDIAPEAWGRVMINHYRDDAMEHARRECVRLLGVQADGDRTKLTEEDVERLRALAASLRRP